MLQFLYEGDDNVATLWIVAGIKELNACKVFRTVCYANNGMLHNALYIVGIDSVKCLEYLEYR